MSKFDKFTDGYIYFCDCGVRAWMFYVVVIVISLIITLLDYTYQPWAFVVMFLGTMLMIGLWYRDYAIRYIPEFWIELGKGKNYQN